MIARVRELDEVLPSFEQEVEEGVLCIDDFAWDLSEDPRSSVVFDDVRKLRTLAPQLAHRLEDARLLLWEVEKLLDTNTRTRSRNDHEEQVLLRKLRRTLFTRQKAQPK